MANETKQDYGTRIADQLTNYASTAPLDRIDPATLQQDLLAIAGDRHPFKESSKLGTPTCYLCGLPKDDSIHTDDDVRVQDIGVMSRVMVRTKLRGILRGIEQSLDTQNYSLPQVDFHLMRAYYDALRPGPED